MESLEWRETRLSTMKLFTLGFKEDSAWFWADLTVDEITAWRRSTGEKHHVHAPSLAPFWQEFSGEMKGMREPGEPEREVRDFARLDGLSGLRCLSGSALKRTESLWGLVEVLPLQCRDGEYWCVHFNRHHDILDLEASTYRTPTELNSRIGSLDLLVREFDVSGLDSFDAFRVPQEKAVFCTEEFVERLGEAEVTGWKASQVYPPTEAQLEFEESRFRLFPDSPRFTFGDRSLRR